VKRFYLNVSTLLFSIGSICLVLAITFFSIHFCAYNKYFYDNEFTKFSVNEDLELSQNDLDSVRDVLIGYMNGELDDLQVYVVRNGETRPFYDEDELSHMLDVKIVFEGFRTAEVILFFIAIFFLLTPLLFIDTVNKICNEEVITTKKYVKKVFKVSFISIISFLVFLGIFVSVVIINYDEAFILFHEIFFSQGNWMFDSDSLMINMLPDGLFFDAAVIIGGTGIGGALVLTLTSGIGWFKSRSF
jgi:integral membrane protein (TIGR01906 family)